MDAEELTLEEKCENLMNIVVESRKRFGKMSVDYDQKSSLMENKILNLRVKTLSNFRSKSKNTVSNVNCEDMCKDIDDFVTEIEERKKRIDSLQRKIKDTQKIVVQLKHDNIGKKVHQKVSAQDLLSLAKMKIIKSEKMEE